MVCKSEFGTYHFCTLSENYIWRHRKKIDGLLLFSVFTWFDNSINLFSLEVPEKVPLFKNILLAPLTFAKYYAAKSSLVVFVVGTMFLYTKKIIHSFYGLF